MAKDEGARIRKEERLKRELEDAERKAREAKAELRDHEKGAQAGAAAAVEAAVEEEFFGSFATLGGAAGNGVFRGFDLHEKAGGHAEAFVGGAAILAGRRLKQRHLIRAGAGFASRYVSEKFEKATRTGRDQMKAAQAERAKKADKDEAAAKKKDKAAAEGEPKKKL